MDWIFLVQRDGPLQEEKISTYAPEAVKKTRIVRENLNIAAQKPGRNDMAEM